jgi:hypothetical protein
VFGQFPYSSYHLLHSTDFHSMATTPYRHEPLDESKKEIRLLVLDSYDEDRETEIASQPLKCCITRRSLASSDDMYAKSSTGAPREPHSRKMEASVFCKTRSPWSIRRKPQRIRSTGSCLHGFHDSTSSVTRTEVHSRTSSARMLAMASGYTWTIPQRMY